MNIDISSTFRMSAHVHVHVHVCEGVSEVVIMRLKLKLVIVLVKIWGKKETVQDNEKLLQLLLL